MSNSDRVSRADPRNRIPRGRTCYVDLPDRVDDLLLDLLHTHVPVLQLAGQLHLPETVSP